jgi:hypothetical protein
MDAVLGRRMFDFFVANEDVLGIQSVIFRTPTDRIR